MNYAAPANVEKAKAEILHLLGCDPSRNRFWRRAKARPRRRRNFTSRYPAAGKILRPPDTSAQPTAALILTLLYNDYKGVIASVKVVDGEIKKKRR